MQSCYRALKNQIYQAGRYAIVPIRMEDRYEIMKWRNEQIFHLRQAAEITINQQDNYFNNIISKQFDQEKPDQILFSYLEDGICIGYGGLVHMNWVDKNAEISFLLNTEIEKDGFSTNWKQYLQLIERVAFEDLHLHKIFTFAFDLRPHLYNILESAGFHREAVLKEHCFFEEKYIDVVIHSKLKS